MPSKISFTHLIAWAILRALETFPRLNDAYAELDGKAHRVQRDSVRFGLAIDVQRRDGSRTLLVPNIRDATRSTSRPSSRHLATSCREAARARSCPTTSWEPRCP